MLANAVEQLGDGLVVQVGQVRAIERRVAGSFSGKLKLNGILPWNHGLTVCLIG